MPSTIPPHCTSCTACLALQCIRRKQTRSGHRTSTLCTTRSQTRGAGLGHHRQDLASARQIRQNTQACTVRTPCRQTLCTRTFQLRRQPNRTCCRRCTLYLFGLLQPRKQTLTVGTPQQLCMLCRLLHLGSFPRGTASIACPSWQLLLSTRTFPVDKGGLLSCTLHPTTPLHL